MPINIGSTPQSHQKFTDVSNLPWVGVSGLYEIEITNAFRDSVQRKDGSTWHFIRIDGLTFGDETRRVSFKLSLPDADEFGRAVKSNSGFDGLLYFLNLRNAQGEYELDDPVVREGVSKSGNPYRFEKYEFLAHRRLHVLLEFRGWYQDRNGREIGTYDLRGVCDADGRSAHDAATGEPGPVEYLEVLRGFAPSPGEEPAPEPVHTPDLGSMRPNRTPQGLKRKSAQDRAAGILQGNNRNGRNGGGEAGDDIPF